MKQLEKSIGWLLRQTSKLAPYEPHNRYLEGNFAPVAGERSSTELQVTGSIPAELSGVYARIGPNPISVKNPGQYHWFTGDGMVHGIRLAGGRALWSHNRYIGTNDVQAQLGRDPLPGPRRGVFDTVNTNIIRHQGRNWALVEAGPYPVELDGELNSVRHGLFNSDVNSSFTAHPHADPATGELHAICYDGTSTSHIRYLCIDAQGQVAHEVKIPVKHGPMIHDCAVSKSRVVILDLPVTFSTKALLTGSNFPYAWNAKHPARIGLLPKRGAATDIRWYDIDPCFVFHTCNAFDLDDGTLVVDVVVHRRMFDQSRIGPEAEARVSFERWQLKPNATRVERTVLSTQGQEFPRFDERLAGQKYRYAYTISAENIQDLKPNSLIRYDLNTGEILERSYGSGKITGEAVFIPRTPTSAETDGWLMSFVHDEHGGNTALVLVKADDFLGDPQAVIELPYRVPLGFHGNWLAD